MLMHATVNTIASGFAFQFVDGVDLQRLWWIYTCAWLITAAVTAIGLRQVGTDNAAATTTADAPTG
jgi:hypothetical protein